MSKSNHLWLEAWASAVPPDNVELMHALAQKRHPQQGVSELVGTRPIARRSDDLSQLAAYADVVTMKCFEHLGWRVRAPDVHARSHGRKNLVLDEKRIGNLAFIAKHHSDRAVRERSLAQLEDLLGPRDAPLVSSDSSPPLSGIDATAPTKKADTPIVHTCGRTGTDASAAKGERKHSAHPHAKKCQLHHEQNDPITRRHGQHKHANEREKNRAEVLPPLKLRACLAVNCRRAAALVCSRCNTASYCHRACQQADWMRHGVECIDEEAKSIAKIAEAAAAAASATSPESALAKGQKEDEKEQKQESQEHSRGPKPAASAVVIVAKDSDSEDKEEKQVIVASPRSSGSPADIDDVE